MMKIRKPDLHARIQNKRDTSGAQHETEPPKVPAEDPWLSCNTMCPDKVSQLSRHDFPVHGTGWYDKTSTCFALLSGLTDAYKTRALTRL